MQIKSPHVKSYRSFQVSDTLPAEARERLRWPNLFQTLRGRSVTTVA